MAERVTGGRPHHGRVGKSSATREELEEAESTHHTRSRGETEALGCLGLLLGPSFLRDVGGTIPRRWPPMPAAAHAVVRRGRPARPHRVCPPAEGAVPPPPHLAEQQVLARRCSTGFLLEDGGLIARVSYRARPHLSLSLLFCFFALSSVLQQLRELS